MNIAPPINDAGYTTDDNLQLSKLIMSVLEDGYVIPFVEEPTSCSLKNNAAH